MSIEKMRAEFEVAAEDHFWLQELSGEYDDAEQQYLDETVQTAWEFWQLSREALVVELPPPLDADEIDDDLFGPVEIADGVNEIIARCRTAIEAAGVRVRP